MSLRYQVLPASSLELAASHPILASLYVRSVGCVPAGEGSDTRRGQGMDEYILQYAAKGVGWAEHEGGRWRLPAGSCIVIPPRMAHAYGGERQDPWLNYWAHFRGRLASRYFELLGLGEADWLVVLPPDQEIVDCFEGILGAYADGHTLAHLLRGAALFNQLLSRLFFLQRGNQPSPGGQSPGVVASIRYMHENIGRKLSLEELARAASLSRARYHQLFRIQTGETPIEYFNQLRIRKACSVLLSSDDTIESIALGLGFSSAFYFSRVFRQTMGVSPSVYRAQSLG